ncbi:MAG: prefoldin subunit [Candidatus Njordarchaeota archaeon]
MSSEDIRRAQMLQQQLLLLEEHLRVYKQRLIEVDNALKIMNQVKEKGEEYAFQFLGANVMVKRKIDDLINEISEDKEVLKERVKTLETQAREIRRRLAEITKKLEAARATQGA